MYFQQLKWLIPLLILSLVPQISVEAQDCRPFDYHCTPAKAALPPSQAAIKCLSLSDSEQLTNCFKLAALDSYSLAICQYLPRKKAECVESLHGYAELLQMTKELHRTMLTPDEIEEEKYPRNLNFNIDSIKVFSIQDPLALAYLNETKTQIELAITNTCEKSFASVRDFTRCMALIAINRPEQEIICRAVFTQGSVYKPPTLLPCEQFSSRNVCNHRSIVSACTEAEIGARMLQKRGCVSGKMDDDCIARVTAASHLEVMDFALHCGRYEELESPRCSGRKDIPFELRYGCSFANDPANCYSKAAKAARSIVPCAEFDRRFRIHPSDQSYLSLVNSVELDPLSALREFNGQVRTCVEGIREKLPISLTSSGDFFECLSTHPLDGCVALSGFKGEFPQLCDWYESQFPKVGSGSGDVTRCFSDLENLREGKPLSLDGLPQPMTPYMLPLPWKYIIGLALLLNYNYFFRKRKKN